MKAIETEHQFRDVRKYLAAICKSSISKQFSPGGPMLKKENVKIQNLQFSPGGTMLKKENVKIQNFTFKYLKE